MTVRTAELLMAIMMGIFSIYLMYKSAELPIGWIEDEGPGLPPSVRERLFTPHVTTKSTGTGMGLFLAHRIATSRLGGTLRLDDRPSGGTVAVLELPLDEESPDA